MQEIRHLPLDEADARAIGRLREAMPTIIDIRRQRARLDAEEARVLAETNEIIEDWVVDAGWQRRSEAEMPHRIVASEIAAAWRVSDRTVQRQIGDATTLVNDYPATYAALQAGRISSAHVRVILAAGVIITRPELRAEYEAAILPYAETEAATRVAPIARLRAQWFSDTTVDERHQKARLQRRVSVTDLDDGMAELTAILPAVLARGAYDRVSQLARLAQDAQATPHVDEALIAVDELLPPAPPDTRTLNELRADILSDLLLSGEPSSIHAPNGGLREIRANVQVTVPVLRLIGDNVADPFDATTLVGYGPIDADTARILAAEAPGWDRILTHPITGAILDVHRYRPSEEMRRHLRARDQHCRFIACRVPARLCDIDHTRDYALGGPTDVTNLAHFCERHHTGKHKSPWKVVQKPGGVLEFTSPTGLVYIDRPVSQIAFATDADSDPPPF